METLEVLTQTIPKGWKLMPPGTQLQTGDKFWAQHLKAWLPVLGHEVRDGYIAGVRPNFLIRKAS